MLHISKTADGQIIFAFIDNEERTNICCYRRFALLYFLEEN